jgi:serine/threonine protein kinase
LIKVRLDCHYDSQAYLAPELFESAPITPAADVWSLGATLYAAADGKGPFERDSTAATLRAILVEDPPVPPGKHGSESKTSCPQLPWAAGVRSTSARRGSP